MNIEQDQSTETSLTKPLLVVIFGASGSGKTTLLQELASRFPSITIHRKGTDRPLKRYDTEEITSVKSVTSAEYDYIYSQYGHHYGIQRKQIDTAFSQGKDHFVICNDIDTIGSLKRDYPQQVRAVYLLFDSPRAHVEAIQKARGIRDDEVRIRLQKISILADLYLDNRTMFDAIVVNRLAQGPQQLVRQLRQFIGVPREVAPMPAPSPAQIADVIGEAVSVIEKQQRESRPDSMGTYLRGYIFIVMAMAPDDPFLDDTCASIKRAASQACFRAERADDIAHTDTITDKILGSIRLAEMIVADITHNRPNVYYEVGYAHAIGKPVILVARKDTKIHFDIHNYHVLFYSSATELERLLKQRIESLCQPLG